VDLKAAFDATPVVTAMDGRRYREVTVRTTAHELLSFDMRLSILSVRPLYEFQLS
jgi:hypothetical protein